jgi:RNA 2',3'-cyclic 3'-phosphodiesterase
MPRLFFALWPDEDLRSQLALVSEQIPAGCGRRIPVNNLHITLVFLGNIDDKKTDCIIESARSIGCGKINLTLNRIGWWKKAQVVWFAPSVIPDKLVTLAGNIASSAGDCGIRVDRRPYQPHMTLVRKVKISRSLPEITPIHWSVDKFALIESTTALSGVRYEPVWTSS